jgi:hypothetical protein
MLKGTEICQVLVIFKLVIMVLYFDHILSRTCALLSKSQGLVCPEGLGKLKK